MNSDLSSVRINERNTPLCNNRNTSLALSAQSYHSRHRRYTITDNIVAIAIEKFKKNQHGITFEDLRKRGLAAHKRQAQEMTGYICYMLIILEHCTVVIMADEMLGQEKGSLPAVNTPRCF